MKSNSVTGLIAAVLAAASISAPSFAADLGQPYGGSLKDEDGYVASPMAPMRSGPCYVRGDVGYSWGRSPTTSWPVTTTTIDNTTVPNPTTTYTYAGDSVTGTQLGNTMFGGVGLGCGSGVRGLRGEVMFDQTGQRSFTGTPLNYTVTTIGGAAPGQTNIVDPVHTSVASSTLMFNGYYDIARWGHFTPYVGAGVGVAYNRTNDVYFTANPNLVNDIQGDGRMSLAWSLMAGVGVALNDRATLDVGYRYMDYGKAQSGQVDNTGSVNPPLRIGDMTANEIKVGLRYSFGGNDYSGYLPMK